MEEDTHEDKSVILGCGLRKLPGVLKKATWALGCFFVIRSLFDGVRPWSRPSVVQENRTNVAVLGDPNSVTHAATTPGAEEETTDALALANTEVEEHATKCTEEHEGRDTAEIVEADGKQPAESVTAVVIAPQEDARGPPSPRAGSKINMAFQLSTKKSREESPPPASLQSGKLVTIWKQLNKELNRVCEYCETMDRPALCQFPLRRDPELVLTVTCTRAVEKQEVMEKRILLVDRYFTKLSEIEKRVHTPANVSCHMSLGVREQTTMMFNAAVKKRNATLKLVRAMKKVFMANAKIAKRTYALKKEFQRFTKSPK